MFQPEPKPLLTSWGFQGGAPALAHLGSCQILAFQLWMMLVSPVAPGCSKLQSDVRSLQTALSSAGRDFWSHPATQGDTQCLCVSTHCPVALLSLCKAHLRKSCYTLADVGSALRGTESLGPNSAFDQGCFIFSMGTKPIPTRLAGSD
jgi:hypothetical protein